MVRTSGEDTRSLSCALALNLGQEALKANYMHASIPLNEMDRNGGAPRCLRRDVRRNVVLVQRPAVERVVRRNAFGPSAGRP